MTWGKSVKIKCDNCPARSRRVRLVTVFDRKLYLCRECVKAARVIASTPPVREPVTEPQQAVGN